MKNKFSLIVMVLLLVIYNIDFAQNNEPRKSPKASVSQTIGTDTEIVFEFSRPGVKGRTIWGELVPWGMEPGNKYSDEKPFPWRGGANENTTISFNNDLLIEGNKIPAGKYSLHFIPGQDEWTVMINSVNDKWGSYTYDSSKDVAKFTVNSIEAPHQEWLTYGFDDYKGNSVSAFLHWEKLKIPFKISLVE